MNTNMTNVGRFIYGYCNGYFGRDDYYDKIIIAEGDKWIVAKRTDPDYPFFDTVEAVNFRNAEEKQELIEDWSVREDE